MNLFRRLFRIGSAEANSLVDKLEDPIKMTEQGIRELKKNLGSALEALAEVKALAIRSKMTEINMLKKQKSMKRKRFYYLRELRKVK